MSGPGMPIVAGPIMPAAFMDHAATKVGVTVIRARIVVRTGAVIAAVIFPALNAAG